MENNLGVTYEDREDYKNAVTMFQQAILSLLPLQQLDHRTAKYIL